MSKLRKEAWWPDRIWIVYNHKVGHNACRTYEGRIRKKVHDCEVQVRYVKKSAADNLTNALEKLHKYATVNGCSCAKGKSVVGANKLCIPCEAFNSLKKFRGGLKKS